MNLIKSFLNKFTGTKAKNDFTVKLANLPYFSSVPVSFPQQNTFQNDIELIKAYYLCPPLNYIIRYRANAISKVKFKAYRPDKIGKTEGEVLNHPIINLLKKPNELQTWQEFIRNFEGNYGLLGNAYMNFLIPEGFSEPTKLFSLPSANMRIQFTDNYNALTSDFRTNSIVKYSMNIGGKYYDIPFENIMHKRETNIDYLNPNRAFFFGKSNAISLEKPINSIISSLDIEQYLTEQSTALGILTGRSGDLISTPTPEQIRETQNKFNSDYGLTADKWKFIITQYPLEFKPINLPIRDLMLSENQLKNANLIYNGYHIPSIFFNNDSATFENKNMARKQYWEDVLIAYIDDLFLDITNSIQKYYKKNEVIIVADYSSIPELKESQTEKLDNAIKLFERGAISRGRLALLSGEQATPEMLNDYYIASNLVNLNSQNIINNNQINK